MCRAEEDEKERKRRGRPAQESSSSSSSRLSRRPPQPTRTSLAWPLLAITMLSLLVEGVHGAEHTVAKTVSPSSRAPRAVSARDKKTVIDTDTASSDLDLVFTARDKRAVSKHSRRRFESFADETCRDKTQELQYWSWEQNEFMYNLRERLLPSTRHGYFDGISTEELRSTILPEMINLAQGRASLCESIKENAENIHEDVQLDEYRRSKDQLENKLIDYLFENIYKHSTRDIDPKRWRPAEMRPSKPRRPPIRTRDGAANSTDAEVKLESTESTTLAAGMALATSA